MPIIKFVNEKIEVEVPEGANLRREAINAGVNLYKGINGVGETFNKYANCWGLGMCGSCRVLITKGMENTNKMTAMERVKFKVPMPDPISVFAFVGHKDTMRLACQTTVHGDIEVTTGPELNLFGENFFS
jgi:ferredoxin